MTTDCAISRPPPADPALSQQPHQRQKATWIVEPAVRAPSASGPATQPVASAKRASAAPSPSSVAPPAKPTQVRNQRLAQLALRRGMALYHQGDYEGSEEHLTRALALDPFSASTNLFLGKIFLLRGAAKRDKQLMQSARRLFEMAHSLDGELQEASMMLHLIGATPP